MSEQSLRDAFWKNPHNTAALSVWADYLSERGDPRGEFIHLSLRGELNEKQLHRYAALRKLGGKLVGPARAFLSSFDFGTNGLVNRAACQAQKLIAGFETICELSPRLELTVTALRTKTRSTFAAMSELALERIEGWRLEAGSLDDSALVALSNGLSRIRRLSLVGNPDLTSAGIIELGRRAQHLEVLAISGASKADAILKSSSAYPSLKALFVDAGYFADRAVVATGRPAVRMREVQGSAFNLLDDADRLIRRD